MVGRLALVFASVLSVCFALVVSIGMPAASASAAAPASVDTVHLSATPAPSPEPTSDFTSTFTVSGIIKSGDEGVESVDVAVSGNGFDETVSTNAQGRWTVNVPEPGTYTVALDESTLPDGVALRDGTEASKEITLAQTNSVSVLFPTGEDTRQTTGFGEQLLIRIVAGLNFGLLLALAAIGITLIFGTTGLNNFAQGEMVTFGAIMSWVFGVLLGLNIVVATIVAVLLGAVFGYLNDAVIWKPLRRRGVRLVQAMVVSIGLSIVLRYVYLFNIGGQTKTMNVGLSTPVIIGPLRLTVATLISMGLSVVVLLAVGYFLTRTRIGKATRAVSDNASLAAASGINVDRIIRIVWILAGALSALAGVMFALYRQVSWDMGFQILLMMFAAVTLGGLGTAFGALIGSIVVGLFVELSTLVLPPDLKYASALVVLILVLLVRPQGILGRRERIG
ncbi:amino acid/amide ABC transporter membrane protein 1, HAAT family [Okibacterium fritillariae]|uniref:Amino acid/amide ABC transporter membrane protein 1, HAAT family n=2 Tax=Okibacterium fritillariae TaxID=123320 RepID=A0A1T5K8B3_9MICO|nr:amino acid/amide ABC transporter membrane protein 1, HAAT family [Okibacterium fritillariae]